MVGREAIYAALFELLKNVPGIRTASRRLRHWDDVPPPEQPALFMTQRELAGAGRPQERLLEADIYLYVHAGGDPQASPAPAVNELLDAVEEALAPAYEGGRQDLGGLVHHCAIGGAIETDEGTLGAQAVALIPVRIIVG